MSSLGAPRRPSDPAGGGDNNRADTATQSACERNLEWVGKRVRRDSQVRFPTLKSGPGTTLRLSAVQCRAHASGVWKRVAIVQGLMASDGCRLLWPSMYATAWLRSLGLTLVAEYSRFHRRPNTLLGCRLAA